MHAIDEANPIPLVIPRRHLPLRVRLGSTMDDDALFEFCAVNRELRIERAADGELLIMSPTGGEAGRRNFALIGQLAAWAERDGSGVGFDSSTGFVLGNGAERSPDAAWVRKERWEALSAEQRRRFPPLCPDFVVELRSPSDALSDGHAKMREYVDNGLRLGWLIDPDTKTVWAYHAGGGVDRLDGAASISGGSVLPGFTLDLTRLG